MRRKQPLDFINEGISDSPFTSCPLTQEDLARERWTEHFQEVLNRPMPTNVAMQEGCFLVVGEEFFDIDTYYSLLKHLAVHC